MSLLSLAGLGCATTEYKFTPTDEARFVQPGQAECLPVSISSDTGAGTARLGSAVALVSWGSDAAASDARASVAAGAPAANGGAGRVRVNEVHPVTSELEPYLALPPPAGSLSGFGTALLGADVREPFGASKAIGQELLVGAPGGAQDGGEIFWYYEDPTANGTWVLGGSYQPPNLSSGASFGAALAAARPSSGHPAWIAVGAPGTQQVYVVTLAPTAASPFAVGPALQITSSSPGFGSAVTSGDFDGDGIPDLAVGAPAGAAGGQVVVFRGTSATPPAFAAPLVLHRGPGPDQLGTSLDAGRFFGSAPSQDGLLAGAPGIDVGGVADVGGFCQYLLGASGAGLAVVSSVCLTNVSGAASDRMGQAVAAGNFNPADRSGSMSTLFAQIDEVAVGVPGATGGIGEVLVLPTDEWGVTGLAPLTTLHGTGLEQGAAMAHGFALGAAMHPAEDLVVGTPGPAGAAGGLYLTLGEQAGASACPSLSGTWQGSDSRAALVSATIGDPCDGSLAITLNEKMVFKVVDGTGAVCSVGGNPLTVRVAAGTVLSATWNGATGQMTIDTGTIAGSVIVDLALSGADLTLTVENKTSVGASLPAGCSVAGNPFVFSEVAPAICD